MNIEDVYFIPGTMCNDKLWVKLIPKFNAIHPHNIDVTKCNSFDEINNVINNILPAQPSHLVGFSLGGYSSLNFAINFPNRVKTLTLIAVSAKGLDNNEINLRNSYINLLQKSAYKGISEIRIKQFLTPESYQNKDIVRIIKEMDIDLGKEVLIRQLKATTNRINLIEKLSSLKIPVMLVGGDEDQLVSFNELREMKSKIKKSYLVNINKSGHMIPLEKPQILADLLQEFIQINS